MPCSFCGIQGVNKKTCPFNPDGQHTRPEHHHRAPLKSMLLCRDLENYPSPFSPICEDRFIQLEKTKNIKSIIFQVGKKGSIDRYSGKVVKLRSQYGGCLLVVIYQIIYHSSLESLFPKLEKPKKTAEDNDDYGINEVQIVPF
jgi:hypothetical protein